MATDPSGPARGGGRVTEDDGGRELVAWERAALIATRGRHSGAEREVVVGFVREPDGALLVGGGSNDADWVRNLLDDARATVTVGDRTWTVRAEPLDGPDAARAIAELIVRYGTPAERLVSGQAFRLVPTDGEQPIEQRRTRPASAP